MKVRIARLSIWWRALRIKRASRRVGRHRMEEATVSFVSAWCHASKHGTCDYDSCICDCHYAEDPFTDEYRDAIATGIIPVYREVPKSITAEFRWSYGALRVPQYVT